MRAGKQSAAAVAALACALLADPAGAAIIAVDQDVMTSPFFTGTDLARGYPGDNRNVHRVSTTDPFGTVGAETIYLTFDYDFSSFTTPVRATLTLQPSRRSRRSVRSPSTCRRWSTPGSRARTPCTRSP
jgi:hypothetical protein